MIRRKKLKLKKSQIKHILNFVGSSKKPLRSIMALVGLGISIGIAYEEMVGIGTWHSFHLETDKINICFTPPSGCGSLIAQEISKAKHTIYVQAYALTDPPIIHQLKSAKDRGLIVRVILDGGGLSNNAPIFEELHNSGIEVFYDKMSGIAHNKVIIIDQYKVITGSFNFTKAADTRNAENVILIEDINIANTYVNNWQERKINLRSY